MTHDPNPEVPAGMAPAILAVGISTQPLTRKGSGLAVSEGKKLLAQSVQEAYSALKSKVTANTRSPTSRDLGQAIS